MVVVVVTALSVVVTGAWVVVVVGGVERCVLVAVVACAARVLGGVVAAVGVLGCVARAALSVTDTLVCSAFEVAVTISVASPVFISRSVVFAVISSIAEDVNSSSSSSDELFAKQAVMQTMTKTIIIPVINFFILVTSFHLLY